MTSCHGHSKPKMGKEQRGGMHGRGAEDLYVRVLKERQVRDAETGKVITDLVENGQEASSPWRTRRARNIRFATPKNPV